jgi:GAF domain-containing protein
MESVSLPRNTLLALRSLTDQMTTSLLNRDLLEQTEENLQETRILYDANRALLEAGDPVDALQAIFDVVAPNAQFISLVSIGYDMLTKKINSFRLEARATMNGSERLDQELVHAIGAKQLDQFQVDWQQRGAEIDFAENLANDHFMRPVLDFYKNQDMDIQSNITIPIIDEGMIIQYLNVAFAEPQTFDRITRRLYKAVRDQMSIVLQNQRLMRDTRTSAAQLGNQVRVLQTLNQLAINLSTFQDETALLNEAAQALYNALGLDHVGIMLLNPDGVTGKVVGEYPAHNFIGMQVADTDELQIHIRKDRVPIYIPSIEQEKNLSANSREEFKRLGIKTLLLIPLFDANEQFFGSVGLEFYQEGREFTSEMTDVARTITAQLVVALQNVRQVRRIQQQADQLQQLANFSQTLQTKLELDSILEAVAEAVPTILQLDHMSVMIWDNHTGKMQVILEVKDGKTLREPRKLPQELNITTAGQAWANRQFVHIANLTKNPDLSYTLQAAMLDVMSAPIFSRGITLGIIEVGNQEAYSYSDVDLLVFRQLVNQLEVALENAEVYMQSQRVARSKALVNEISSLIQKQADLDSILNVTINELGKALGAKQARVRLGTLDNDHEKTERW